MKLEDFKGQIIMMDVHKTKDFQLDTAPTDAEIRTAMGQLNAAGHPYKTFNLQLVGPDSLTLRVRCNAVMIEQY